MSPGIASALGALVMYGLADFIYKRGAAAGALPHRFLMVQTWCFNILALAYAFVSGGLVFNRGALWGAAAGVLVVVGYYNFAWSLRHGAVSTNAAIFRLSFVVTALLGVVVLGEALTAAKIAGVVLAFLAVWLLLAVRPEASSETLQSQDGAIARVLVATVAVGFASFTYKLGLLAGALPSALVVAQGAMALVLFTGFSVYIDGGVHPSREALSYAPVSALLLVVAFTLLAQSLERGEASVVVPIAQMGFVVSAVLGFVFLKEPLTRRKVAGLVVALLALASFVTTSAVGR